MNFRLLLIIIATGIITIVSSFTGPKPKEQKDPMVEISTKYGKMVVRLYNKTPKHRDNFLRLVKSGLYDSLLFHRCITDFMIQGGDPNSKYAKPGELVGDGDLGYKIPAELVPEYYHKRGALAAARDDSPDGQSNASQFYIVKGKKFSRKELAQIMNSYNYNAKMTLFSSIMKSDSIKTKVDDYLYRGDNDGLTAYTQSVQVMVDSLFLPYMMDFSQAQIQHYTNIGGVPHLDKQYTVFGEVVSGMHILDSIISQPTDKNDRPLTDIRMKMRLLP